MNERVRKLMLEAGYAAPEIAGRAHKLVELIVKECVVVGSKVCRDTFEQSDMEGDSFECRSHGAQDVIDAIEDHFK